MSLAITIELGDADLQHFIDAMRRAQEEAKHLSPQQVTDEASKLLVEGHHVQLPQFVPARRDFREIGRRLGLLAAAHAVEPEPVSRAFRIVAVEPLDQPAAELGGSLAVGEPVIRPRSLGIAGDEPGVGQQFQVARDAGLALAKDFGQILDRVLALGEERQKPQPRRLPGRAQCSHQCRRIRQKHLQTRYKDIFMSGGLQGFEAGTKCSGRGRP